MRRPFEPPPAALAILLLLSSCLAREGAAPPPPAPAPPTPAPQELRPAALGERLPDLVLPDLDGAPVALRSLVGRPTVLLWIDPACSFLRDAALRRDLAGRIAAWRESGAAVFAVDSTGPGRTGAGAQADREFLAAHLSGLRCLLDESGAAGRALLVERVPTAVVLDADGRIRYRGAIDDAPFGWTRGGGEEHRWVEAALEALRDGRLPEPAETRAWGCRVRYASDAPRPAGTSSGNKTSTPTAPGTGS